MKASGGTGDLVDGNKMMHPYCAQKHFLPLLAFYLLGADIHSSTLVLSVTESWRSEKPLYRAVISGFKYRLCIKHSVQS